MNYEDVIRLHSKAEVSTDSSERRVALSAAVEQFLMSGGTIEHVETEFQPPVLMPFGRIRDL